MVLLLKALARLCLRGQVWDSGCQKKKKKKKLLTWHRHSCYKWPFCVSMAVCGAV